MDALLRIQSRFDDVKGLSFKELIKLDEYVLRLSSGDRPTTENMTKAFKAFLVANDLLADKHGNNRTLYSLRHMYATFSLLEGIDMHTLARQMGTSVNMLDKQYSKLTPQMKAKQLSGVSFPRIKSPLNKEPASNDALEVELMLQQEQIAQLTNAINQLTSSITTPTNSD